jgi:hypothetical protein
MKKVLIGCAVVALIAAIGIGIAGYYFVLKPGAQLVGQVVEHGKQALTGAQALVASLQKLEQIEAEVTNQSAYTPPEDGRLTPEQITRFLAVQDAITRALEPYGQELEHALQPKAASDAAPELGAAIGLLGRLGDAALAVKRAQVEALNAQQLSLAEYRWIRGTGLTTLVEAGLAGGLEEARRQSNEAKQVLRGLTDVLTRVDPELGKKLPPWLGNAPPGEAAVAPPADAEARAANLALVQPHLETFVRAYSLAQFGF